MPPRPCIDCAKPCQATRCTTCEATRQRIRNQTRTHYDAQWRRIRTEALAAQPWCSRCGATDDLTVDHILPRSLVAGVQVLCRSCNSSKGGRWTLSAGC